MYSFTANYISVKKKKKSAEKTQVVEPAITDKLNGKKERESDWEKSEHAH